jgi:hypothetical protein
MADDVAKLYPGTNDISDQFSAANIGQTLVDYNALKDSHDDYTFGELTAKFYNLDPTAHGHWKNDIARFYPKNVQNEIKRHIIHAMTNKDDHGHDKPIPLSIKWQTPIGPKSITCTFDPSGPSYTIVISGFRQPLSTSFANRSGKY